MSTAALITAAASFSIRSDSASFARIASVLAGFDVAIARAIIAIASGWPSPYFAETIATGIPSRSAIFAVSMRMPNCFASSAMLSSSTAGRPSLAIWIANASWRSTCTALSTIATRSIGAVSSSWRTTRSSSEKPWMS